MADQRFRAVRALIFDLDGTLIDSKQDLIHSVNAMLRELKREELAAETISGFIVGQHQRATILTMLRAGLGLRIRAVYPLFGLR